MAGVEEGALRRCTAETVGAPEMTGDGSGRTTMEGCSTKRKTPEETVSGGQVFAPLMDCVNKRAAAAAAAAAAEGPAAVEKAAGGETPPGPKARMPEREVRRILSWKPKPIPRRYEEALKRGNPAGELTPGPGAPEVDEDAENLYFVARAFYCMEERFPKMQEWVREELRTKGFVEMDDDWVRRRAEAQEAVDEGWKKIEKRIQELQFSEDEIDYDDDDSDSDDDDEGSGNGDDSNGGREEEEDEVKEEEQ